MARLRDPEHGCPWDREQTWSSIVPHTIEEAYEIADAVERGDVDHVRDELGDLLFQVVFQSRIAEEQGLFRFDDVVDAISNKLERRHPHVFGDATIGSAAEQTAAWEEHKAAERRAKGGAAGALDGVTLGLPALVRAAKLGQAGCAGRVRLAGRGRGARQGARGDRRVAAGAWQRASPHTSGRNSATCFSAWHSSRVTSTSIQRQRCATRAASSKGASAASRPASRQTAGPRRTRAWRSWRRCGHGQSGRSAEGRPQGAEGGRRRLPAARSPPVRRLDRAARAARGLGRSARDRATAFADAGLERSPRGTTAFAARDQLRRHSPGARAPCRDRGRHRVIQRRDRQRRHRQRQEHAVAEDLPRDGAGCRRHDRPHAAATHRRAGARAPRERRDRLHARGPRRLPGALRRSHQPAYAREADDGRPAAARARERPAARTV